MKKTLIIISAIMLNAAMGFAIPKVPKYTVIIDKQNGETTTFQVDSGSIINQQHLAPPTKKDFVFQGWEASADIEKPISQDPVKITARWLSVQEYQARQDSILWAAEIQPKVQELVNKEVDALQSQLLIAYAVAGLALLLAIGLLVCFFLDKKNRRNEIISTVTDEKNYGTREGEKRRLQRWKEDLINNAKTELQRAISSSNSQSYDNQMARTISDLQRRLEKLEDGKKETEKAEMAKQEAINNAANQPKSLYSKSIINGQFYGVKDQADSDTIFELKLSKATDVRAVITIYEPAYTKIIANNDYLEGCEKQVLGNTAVQVIQEGTAEHDGTNWKVKTPLKIEIK